MCIAHISLNFPKLDNFTNFLWIHVIGWVKVITRKYFSVRISRNLLVTTKQHTTNLAKLSAITNKQLKSMAREINNDSHIGARVKLLGEIKGTLLRKTKF